MKAQTLLSHAAAIENESSPHKNAVHSNQASCPYLLPRHVFACQTRDCFVFLDARRNQYLGVGGADAEALMTVLTERPSQEAHDGAVVPISPHLRQALDSLVARELLTLEPASGRQFHQVELQPGSCAVGPGAEYEHAPRLTHIFAALIAYVGARFDLRIRGVPGTVTRLVTKKQKHQRSAFSASADELHRLVCIFRVIRPFLYTKKDQCLLHGLTLYRFLRHYGLRATWVIGVDTAPFGAHCWVQYRECVLDDSPANTLGFTPLLAI